MGCCESCSTYFRAPARWVVGVLEIGIAVAIVNIIYWQLTDYDLSTQEGKIINYQCLLAHDDEGRDVCVYMWAMCGISMVLSLYLMLSVCFSCECWMYVELWIDWILVLLGSFVWLVAGIVLANYASKDDFPASDQKQKYRNAVAILTWINFVLFAFDWFGCTGRLFFKVCGCCGGREYAQRIKEEKEKKREEKRAAKEAAEAAKNGLQPPQAQDLEAPGATVDMTGKPLKG